MTDLERLLWALTDAGVEFVVIGGVAMVLRGSLEAWKRHPEILDGEIRAPVFIVGTARSGTSILCEVLVQDPHFRAPATWEAFYSGAAARSRDVRVRPAHPGEGSRGKALARGRALPPIQGVAVYVDAVLQRPDGKIVAVSSVRREGGWALFRFPAAKTPHGGTFPRAGRSLTLVAIATGQGARRGSIPSTSAREDVLHPVLMVYMASTRPPILPSTLSCGTPRPWRANPTGW